MKVGDEVIIKGRSWDYDSLGRITGETPKFFKVGNKLYNKDTKRLRGGDSWNFSYISEPTEEDKEKILRRILINKLKSFDFNKLETNKLKEIFALSENQEVNNEK